MDERCVIGFAIVDSVRGISRCCLSDNLGGMDVNAVLAGVNDKADLAERDRDVNSDNK